MGINWDNIPLVGPYLKTRKRACRDCAIETGFYSEFLEDLLKQPKDTQIEHARRWFCHSDARKICKRVEEAILK